jgi:hypothetical protein
MPRRAWESRPSIALPTPRHCAAWSATISWHCTTHSHTVGVPHPRREDTRLVHARTGRRRDARLVGVVTSVAIGLCNHPRHRDAIPTTASPSPTMWKRVATGHRHAIRCASYGPMLMAPSSPHADGPRTGNLYAAALKAAPGRAKDAP